VENGKSVTLSILLLPFRMERKENELRMRKNRILANGFAILAVFLAALALGIVVRFRNMPAIVLSISGDAAVTADILMEAVCAGDYETAEEYLYGEPELGLGRPASDEVAAMIWDAFVESQSCSFPGECVAMDGGISRKVIFRSLELASVTENLQQRIQTLLADRVAQAVDISQIYDENHEYRETVVGEVVREAVASALREDARYTERELTLMLTYSEGKWWVVPDSALLNAISGGIAG